MSDLLMDAAPPVREAVAPPNSIAALTATDFLAALGEGRLSAADYASACADRIEQLDPVLKAWKFFDRALFEQRARKCDAALAKGDRSPLIGVPAGIKDIFNTYDMPTGMGSPILDGYTPGNDARVVSNLRLDGAIVAGKTVTAEFAVHHPAGTANPHDLSRSPGTSSSGSAAAVAASMVPVALASQTGGSVIRPASYCGIFGFKPSFGLLPRTGILKTTDTLDSVGMMARSVADLALLFDSMRVRGRNYPVSDAALADEKRQSIGDRPWRVGVVTGPKSNCEAPAARAGLTRLAATLADAGMEVRAYRLPPAFDRAHDTHETIYRRALAYYFSNEWRSHTDLFSPVLRRMIETGLEIPVADYHAATREQTVFRDALDAEFAAFDVLVDLSTADEAPADPNAPELADHCLIWTLCGAPTLSLPLLSGTTGLPVGVQIVARRFNDGLLLRFANAVMDAVGG